MLASLTNLISMITSSQEQTFSRDIKKTATKMLNNHGSSCLFYVYNVLCKEDLC